MSSNEKSKGDAKPLDSLINQAVKKLGKKKENDICRYLPSSKGGYIHHFTMRKMKTEAPEQLQALITKHIMNVDKPTSVPPKRRAPRNSKKRSNQPNLTKQDIETMLHLARVADNKEIIRKLSPKKDLPALKRELIASIRHGKVNQELWFFYVEAMTAQHHLSTTSAAH